MPMIYAFSPATAGNLTTSGTPDTATETFFLKANAAANVGLKSLTVVGKATSATTLSGIALRLKKWTTASTAGTGMTFSPADPRFASVQATGASRPTAGSGGGAVFRVLGVGRTGTGAWVAEDPDSIHYLAGGSGLSLSCDDVCGEASQKFEFSGTIIE